jgi:site-specific recombinase XerD
MALPVLVETAAHVPAAIVPELTATSPRQKAPATRKAYKTDFRFFQEWCQSKGVSALPATRETVAAYLAAQAGALKASTIGRRVAAIRYAHKLAGLETPTDAEAIKATVRGIRRTFGTAKVKKAPAIAGRLIAMVSHAPDTLGGLRDRALLLVGFGGAFRRSALDVEDVTETETACASKSANRRQIRKARAGPSPSRAGTSPAPRRLCVHG